MWSSIFRRYFKHHVHEAGVRGKQKHDKYPVFITLFFKGLWLFYCVLATPRGFVRGSTDPVGIGIENSLVPKHYAYIKIKIALVLSRLVYINIGISR